MIPLQMLISRFPTGNLLRKMNQLLHLVNVSTVRSLAGGSMKVVERLFHVCSQYRGLDD